MTQDEMTALDRGAERIAGMNLAAPETVGGTLVLEDGDRVYGHCTTCNRPAVFRDRNRLANCGHVRRSHGKVLPRDGVPELVKPAEAAPGAITREQAQRLADLITSKDSRRVAWDVCLDAANTREAQFTAACVELDDFIASITAQ